MDELEIEGKKYISSKRASEITGYAKDYVGQLARAQKISATRVGRAWYVEENAILNHAGLNIQSTSNTTSSESVKEISNVVIPIATSIAQLKTPESIQEPNLYSLYQLKNTHTSKDFFSTWDKVNYFEDTDSLIPYIVAPQNTHKIIETEVKINTLKNIVSSPRRLSIKNLSVDGIKLNLSNSNLYQETLPLVKNKNMKPVSNSKKIKKSSHLVPYLTISLTAAVILGAFIYTTIDTGHFAFLSEKSTLATSSVFFDSYEIVAIFFGSIFFNGIALIKSFIFAILDSVEIFFTIGLNFLLNLF